MKHLLRSPRLWISILIGVILIAFIYLLTLIPIDKYHPLSPDEQYVRLFIGDAEIYAILAQTKEERIRGLSGRPGIARNGGMLFIYPEDGYQSIWMKDMRFPIDILWLDRNFRVVESKEGAAPESYPEVFAPKIPARFVLEVPSGFVKEQTIIVGSEFLLAE